MWVLLKIGAKFPKETVDIDIPSNSKSVFQSYSGDPQLETLSARKLLLGEIFLFELNKKVR